MGEMADQILEWMDDALDDYNGLYDEEWEPAFWKRPKKIPTCRYCKTSPLRWRQILGKWVLFDMNGDLHTCCNYLPPIEILQEIKRLKMDKKQLNKAQLLPIPSWDEFFMRHVYLSASKSKDPRTKIGAVLVKGGIIISEGFNGFARGVQDLPKRYLDRITKYKFVVHGESNAILNAARNGICTMSSILYTNGIPCDSCGKTIIQAGIKEVIIHKQWPEILSEAWRESTEITQTMFREAGINIRVLDCPLKLQGLVDGRIIDV